MSKVVQSIPEWYKKKYKERWKRWKLFGYAVDEPTDDDVIALDGMPSTENINELRAKILANEPFFVIGHAGWGKTSIIKKVAKGYGRTVVTVYLHGMLPEDLGGIPVPVQDENTGTWHQEILLPKWAQYIYDNPDTDFLLLFEYMNLATPEMMSALKPIILENVICGIKFDNILVGGEGNYKDEDDHVHDIPSTIISCFRPIIYWKDNDDEAWEDAMNYLKRKWSDKIEDEIIRVCDKYKTFFMNPRKLETNIFEWVNNLRKNAQEMGRQLDKHRFDINDIEEHVCSLFVSEFTTQNMAGLKKEVLADAAKKRAIKEITETIYKLL